MTKHNWFYSQLFTNWKRFEVIYVSILILLQLAVFAIVPDSPIGMISGVAGVICLVYGMKGRKISFIFGFIQCVAMTYVAWISHAYGSFAMDIVYVISQPIGWYLWGRQQQTHSFQPGTRKKVFFGAFLAWAIGWWVLAGVGGQLPYFDSINFVISFIAQVLYVLKYNESRSLCRRLCSSMQSMHRKSGAAARPTTKAAQPDDKYRRHPFSGDIFFVLL